MRRTRRAASGPSGLPCDMCSSTRTPENTERARALLPTGCDAVVLSTEECGFPVADPGQDVVPLTDSEATVLSALSAVVSLIDIRNNRACAASEDIARQSSLSIRQTQDILRRLEQRGLVLRVGERSGWTLPPPPGAPAPSSS